MSEWIEKQLGQLATIDIGGTPTRETAAYWAGNTVNGYPWVSIADMGPRFVVSTKERITDLGVCKSNTKLVKAGTLMMSFKLTIGRVGIAGMDLYTNEAIASIYPRSDRVDSSFLYYVLPDVARRSVTDTAVKGATLNKNKLHRLSIKFPTSLREQEKIAKILSTIDDAIERTEALIAKMRQINAGLMQDLFTRGVMPNGQLRPPREKAPQLYKESPLGWIPREWSVHPLGSIAESVIDGPFGSNLKTEHYVDNTGVGVVRLQNILENEYNDSDRAFISKSHALSLSRYSVIGGDVLIAALGDDVYPAGRACCYPADLLPAINKADCFRLRSVTSLALNAFIMGFLNTRCARTQTMRYVQGVTRKRINLGNMRRILVSLPSIEEQRHIVAVLQASYNRRDSLESGRDKLTRLKSGLMNDLLTGRVRVPEALLKRTAAST